ncbi:unnamed protein product, partial [Meganyctiphanes norvegica]
VQNSLQCAKDYLEISDVEGVLEKACGAKNPPTDLTTATNTLSLNFVANSGTTRKSGFSCTATCVQKHNTTLPQTKMESIGTATSSKDAQTRADPATCGPHAISPGEKITVESPSHPLKYPANHECTWDITCSDPNSQIEFSCSVFQLQNSNGCRKDYLQISDSTGPISKACRKDIPSGIVTASNTLSLNFVTNDDNIRKPGFSCDATCVKHCNNKNL